MSTSIQIYTEQVCSAKRTQFDTRRHFNTVSWTGDRDIVEESIQHTTHTHFILLSLSNSLVLSLSLHLCVYFMLAHHHFHFSISAQMRRMRERENKTVVWLFALACVSLFSLSRHVNFETLHWLLEWSICSDFDEQPMICYVWMCIDEYRCRRVSVSVCPHTSNCQSVKTTLISFLLKHVPITCHAMPYHMCDCDMCLYWRFRYGCCLSCARTHMDSLIANVASHMI